MRSTWRRHRDTSCRPGETWPAGPILCLAIAVAGVWPAHAQQVARELRIAPAVFRGEDVTTVGARWSIRDAFGGNFRGDVYPRRMQAEFSTTGAAALDPEANPETIRAGGAAGWFIALFRPPIDPDPTDPDAVPVGGFDYGSVSIGLSADVESDQRFREVNAALGGRVAYVNSRQDYPWPLLPAVRLQFGAILPLATEAEDRIDAHTRGDLYAAWHLPLPQTPIIAHAELWYWSALDAELQDQRTETGLFGSIALAYRVAAPLAEITIHEVFVRWSSGEAPVRPGSQSAWMIGIVAGR